MGETKNEKKMELARMKGRYEDARGAKGHINDKLRREKQKGKEERQGDGQKQQCLETIEKDRGL